MPAFWRGDRAVGRKRLRLARGGSVRGGLVLTLLAACAPAPAPRTQVVLPTAPATYYPNQAGAEWRFLPQGKFRDAPPVVQRVEGPTVVDGERRVAWRTTGRGLDLRTYRDYRPEGIFVVREEGPGYVTTTAPPIQEWPAEGTLKVGSSWGGQATATVYFTGAQETRSFGLEYRYEVVDQRAVTVDAGTFEVFVVAFESASRGPGGEPLETLRQEVWFAPFVGEVRTGSGLFLVSSTVVPEGAAP